MFQNITTRREQLHTVVRNRGSNLTNNNQWWWRMKKINYGAILMSTAINRSYTIMSGSRVKHAYC